MARQCSASSGWYHRATATDAPARSYSLATWVFLRLLGLAYLAAFWSLAVQVQGLIGHDGILPAREYMDAAARWVSEQSIGLDRYRLLPTLCWLTTSDRFLIALCIAGAILAAFLIADVATLVVLPALWLAYLSLSVVGRDFLSFQWDALLLETGLLAVVVAPAHVGVRSRFSKGAENRDLTPVGRWLLWWLLFRLMFGSGAVKLTSGDPTWRSLSALSYHFETQPIPTPLAWYAHHLPASLLTASTAITLAIELVVPFGIFSARRVRHVTCALFVVLQLLIAATGNYAYFNLLTIALAVTLLDDDLLSHVIPPLRRWAAAAQPAPGSVRRWAALAFAAVTVPVSAQTLLGEIGLGNPASALIAPIAELIAPLRSVNAYGLFAVMTTTRPEIEIEGSDDGVTWKAYAFKYKAGDVGRRPPWVAPHQPRLDWQLWFAALGRYETEPWFQAFCQRLLRGSPAVLDLLATDPFRGKAPRMIRASLFQYRFADAAAHRGGAWWTRERTGDYSPVLALDRPSIATAKPGR